MTDQAIRILLADDDAQARPLLAELLQSLGYAVVAEAGSGRDAIALAADVLPDVVLLDVHMPDGSGIEAAQAITATGAPTAVVLFSGDATVSLSPDQARSTAAIAFLPKPSPAGILDSTLRLAVARARELTASREDAALWKRKLEERKTIERAKGILMRRTGSTEQEAYRIMQRSSQDNSVPMAQIAQAVIDSEPGAGTPSPAPSTAGVAVRAG
jgi:response regulator NasT